MRLERVCGKDSIPLWRFTKAFYFQSDAYFYMLSLCREERFLTVFWQRKKRQSCEWRVFVNISHWNSWICQFLNLDLLIFSLFTIKVRIYHKQRIPNDLVIWACIPKFFYWAGTHFKSKKKKFTNSEYFSKDDLPSFHPEYVYHVQVFYPPLHMLQMWQNRILWKQCMFQNENLKIDANKLM